MRVLLVSTYELGHQPLQVASPAAALTAAGHDVAAIDLAVQTWDEAAFDRAEAVAFSVPMHTAMRLAVDAASRLRGRRPGIPVCIYGLYAGVSAEHVLGTVADRVIAGEYEDALVHWVSGLGSGQEPGPGRASVELGRRTFDVPRRDLLPPPDRYAHLEIGGESRLAGYVEATRGCTQRCRHCPVPTVYDGRLRVVDAESVLADVDAMVSGGVRHITFGDPDFLCGPRHTTRLLSEVHAAHPDVTFDVTAKVSHVLAHEALWPDLAAKGLLFVTTAVECLDDSLLGLLDKGHTGADAGDAADVLASAGVDMHPTFLPFTPWTTPDTVAEILAFVRRHRLVGLVDPVQYSLRLLLPQGSLLIDEPAIAPYLEGYDPVALTWTWHAADPSVDELAAAVAALVEADSASDAPPQETFAAVERLVAAAGGREHEPAPVVDEPCGRPRLSESWFCCAEPTSAQHAVVAGGEEVCAP